MALRELDCASSNCVICGSSNLDRFLAFASDIEIETTINIIECVDCGFAWQYPQRRSVDESKEYFIEAYRLSSSINSTDYFVPEQRNAAALLQAKFLDLLKIGGTAKLLDIGAGAGYFARQAVANGWDVTVYDPAINESADLAKYAEIIKNNTYDMPGESFDVVTMWDVIEHVEFPVAALTEATRLLKPGGILVLETGNYMCAERVLQGESHWIYQLDHRWYFSPASLTRILTGVGFIDVRCHKEVLRPHWSGNSSYPGPSRMMFLKEIIKKPTQIATYYKQYCGLLKARTWDNSGLNIFTLYARKPIGNLK